MRRAVIALALAGVLAGGAGLAAQEHTMTPGHMHAMGSDSAYATMQARGQRVMGVDQYTSVHHFDDLGDGGRIQLQAKPGDAKATATIRAHLREIARSFAAGDFSDPMAVHAREVPGTAVMAAKKHGIRYTYRDLPRGGEVRIRSADPGAVRAVHEFLAFQRTDHRAPGRSSR